MSYTGNDRLQQLAARMRAEWDRRVAHDYRYWMSDGVSSDEVMWQVGERDFAILARAVPNGACALDLGCGVGRLLRSASVRFEKVIGCDVSEEALSQAKRLLADCSNVELLLGNGFDISQVESKSVDFAYSFAALGSMPVQVVARYLCELARVVKPHGVVRLQLYLGKEQETSEEDTIAIRSFERSRFVEAARLAGFDLQFAEELTLDFEVSDHEAGSIAHIVSLSPSGANAEDPARVAETLSKSKEKANETWEGSETEYLMAVARAQQHMEQENLEAAAEALRFAIDNYPQAPAEVRTMLAEIDAFNKKAHSKKQTLPVSQMAREDVPVPTQTAARADYFEQNLSVLQARFPDVAASLKTFVPTGRIRVDVGSSGLPVLFVDGKPLDQKEKPALAARAWSERLFNNPHIAKAEAIVVVGFAGAYHISALLERSSAKLHIVEPDLEVLWTSLGVSDLRDTLTRIESLDVAPRDISTLLTQSAGTVPELAIHPQTNIVFRAEVERYRRSILSERGIAQLKPKIGIVGPIYGGSLPIAQYAADALGRMGQRGTYYNLESFYGAYNQFRGMVKSDDRRRMLERDYVDFLSKAVLEAVAEKPVDILICLAQAPLSGEALTELRKRGVITAMWFVEDCRRFTTWQSIAQYFDYMFVIQQGEFPDLVERAGAGRGLYLPVACDPAVHAPLQLTADEVERWGSDVSFVGAGYHNRQQMFAGLTQYNFNIWGTEWPECVPFDSMLKEKGRRISPEEYVKIFNASKVNLNLHSSTERDGVEPNGDFINPRTFELASCGAFQLVDERTPLPDLFDVETELSTFCDSKDMCAKIDHYLTRPDERAEIAGKARARVLKEHTYDKRIREMLGAIYADHFEDLRARQHASPWTRVIEVAEDYPSLQERFTRLHKVGAEPTIEAITADIQIKEGKLTGEDQRLLFLHHIKKQIDLVRETRKGKNE